jgi:hypothetical protein
MKTILLAVAGALAAVSLMAADTNSTDQLKGAIAKLKAETNYSWTVKTELPTMGFTPSPMDGKTEKDGYTIVSQEFNGNTMMAAFKGAKIAVNMEGDWQAYNAAEPGMAWWLARTKTGADEAADLVGKAKDLKAGEGGVLSGDATEAGAKELLTFGPRGGGNDGPPPPKNAKATMKFWLKDGALTKFESHLSGTVSFGPDQEEQQMEVIRTIEFKDLGKTKVEVPLEAKKKLEGN